MPDNNERISQLYGIKNNSKTNYDAGPWAEVSTSGVNPMNLHLAKLTRFILYDVPFYNRKLSHSFRWSN
jgi:hypothetical protein